MRMRQKEVQVVSAPSRVGPMRSVSRALQYLRANRARLFWAWVAYQAIKGTVTLSLVWIPLLLWWLNK